MSLDAFRLTPEQAKLLGISAEALELANARAEALEKRKLPGHRGKAMSSSDMDLLSVRDLLGNAAKMIRTDFGGATSEEQKVRIVMGKFNEFLDKCGITGQAFNDMDRDNKWVMICMFAIDFATHQRKGITKRIKPYLKGIRRRFDKHKIR